MWWGKNGYSPDEFTPSGINIPAINLNAYKLTVVSYRQCNPQMRLPFLNNTGSPSVLIAESDICRMLHTLNHFSHHRRRAQA
jgi:hypothetical protein